MLLRKIINYRKVWKKLGKPYIKADGSWKRLEEYGVQAVSDVFWNQFAILEGDNPVVYFTRIFQKAVFEKDFVVLSMGKKVYVKKKGEEIYEIEELDGYYYYYYNEYHDMKGVLFFHNKSNNTDNYKALSLKTMQVFQLDGTDLIVSNVLGLIQTYSYDTDSCNVYFVKDEDREIYKSDITFLKYFNDKAGYQINYDKKEKAWKLFYLSKNKIETIETYEGCSTGVAEDIADYIVKKKDSTVELVKISGQEIKRFPILGDDFEELKCDSCMFYKSRGTEKVYLYTYRRGNLNLLGEYKGIDIYFGDPYFDKDEAIYKRELVVIR